MGFADSALSFFASFHLSVFYPLSIPSSSTFFLPFLIGSRFLSVIYGSWCSAKVRSPAVQPPYSIRQKFLPVFYRQADNEAARKNRWCRSVEFEFGLVVAVLMTTQNRSRTSCGAALWVLHGSTRAGGKISDYKHWLGAIIIWHQIITGGREKLHEMLMGRWDIKMLFHNRWNKAENYTLVHSLSCLCGWLRIFFLLHLN